jgi:hypothetical protein
MPFVDDVTISVTPKGVEHGTSRRTGPTTSAGDDLSDAERR